MSAIKDIDDAVNHLRFAKRDQFCRLPKDLDRVIRNFNVWRRWYLKSFPSLDVEELELCWFRRGHEEDQAIERYRKRTKVRIRKDEFRILINDLYYVFGGWMGFGYRTRRAYDTKEVHT